MTTTTTTTLSTLLYTPTYNFYSKSYQPIKFHPLRCTNIAPFHQNLLKLDLYPYTRSGFLKTCKGGYLWGENSKLKVQKRVVLVKFNQGFNFNGGDNSGTTSRVLKMDLYPYIRSGFLRTCKNGFLWGEKRKLRVKKRVVLVQGFNFNGGGRGDGTTSRVLGNLVLAVGLTYLTMTGQLGWVLDTIVSLWLLAIFVPIIGIAIFLWWAGRDMIQGACPNCGNPFQVFKSTLNDELQLCPYCSQPFSVEGNKFVKEPIQFSSKSSSPFQKPFDDFSPWLRKENNSSASIVDVEAEVKDAD